MKRIRYWRQPSDSYRRLPCLNIDERQFDKRTEHAIKLKKSLSFGLGSIMRGTMSTYQVSDTYKNMKMRDNPVVNYHTLISIDYQDVGKSKT